MMGQLLSSSLVRTTVLVAFVSSLLLCAVCMAGMQEIAADPNSAVAVERSHGCCARPDATPSPTNQDGSTCDHCDRMLLGVVGVVTNASGPDASLLPFELCTFDSASSEPLTVAPVRIDNTPALSQSPPTLLRLRCAMNL